MSEDDNRSQGSLGVAWFLAGIGVGALIGILYAPKSGKETREDLAQRAQDGKEYLRVRSKQAADQMSDMMDKGKDQMSQYVGRGRDLADRGRAQWQDFVERGKSTVSDKASRVSAAVDAGREAYRSNAGGASPSPEPAEPGV
jgi:gas vesicle protein